MEPPRKKGHFTFRIAAVLLMATAVMELFALGSEVPLFGAVRGGVSAGLYHMVFIALFLGLGVGLWQAKRWGYRLVFVTTAVYTLDKLQLIAGREALERYVAMQMAGVESQLQTQGIDAALVTQAVMLMSLAVILGWWGFALYTYWRRAYFAS